MPNVHPDSFGRKDSTKGLPTKYDPPSQSQDNMPIVARLWEVLRVKNDVGRGMLAEFVGTFILLIFGQGVVAQVVLSENNNGQYLSINIAWGFAVMLAVMVSGGVSGGHINPAVTGTLMLMKKCNLKRGLLYMLMQYLGAFVASFIVYVIYYDALENFHTNNKSNDTRSITQGIFTTFPQPFLTWHGALADQIFGTALLMLCIMAISDPENMKIPSHFGPFFVGLLVLTIGMCFGHNCGYAINPARDLGPRLFIAIAGWGDKVFSVNNYNYFWIPIVGPHIGAPLGALIYKLFISNHWPQKSDDSNQNAINLTLEDARSKL